MLVWFLKSDLYFNGRTLTTNRRPLAISEICPLGLLVYNFMLDPIASSSAMYFSVSFNGSIVTVYNSSMDKSTYFCLDISAFLGLLQYRCVINLAKHQPKKCFIA